MKKWNLWAMVFIFSALLTFTDSGAAYSDGVMAVLPVGTYSVAQGINNNSQIVGYSYISSDNRAWLFSGSTMTAIGALPGGISSEAVSINDRGQIAGHSHTASGQFHAFLYSGGAMTDLGTLGGTIFKPPYSRRHL
jgi:probable HAF family extracellular repeat protein